MTTSSLSPLEVSAKEVPVPTPKAGQLLVRVDAAPINPSDQYFMAGAYNPAQIPPTPYTVGFEGAGTVVEVGEGVEKERWINKKLAFIHPGTWTEYIVFAETYPMKVVMSDKINPVDVASFWINPMTVMNMYDIARKAGVTAVAHNAGASSLGRQLIRLGLKKGFDVVNVVRREAQVEALHAIGAKYVVNMSKDGWQKEWHDITHKLGVTILFDAIGGDVAGEFLAQMPNKSTLYNYGALSGKPLAGFTANDFIFTQKTVTGLWLTSWLPSLKPLDLKDYAGTVAEDLNTGGAIFGSKVAKTFPLEQFKEAVEYANAHTLDGKVYFTPSQKS